MPVALDDLGADRVDVKAERRQHLRLDLRAEVAVRPDRPGDLAGADLVDGGGQARPAALELERPAGELEPERRRLGVDRMGAAHHHRRGLRASPGDEHARAAGRRSSSSRSPAARSWSASPVSTTSLLVSPRWR